MAPPMSPCGSTRVGHPRGACSTVAHGWHNMLLDVLGNIVYVPLFGGLLLFILGVVLGAFAALISGIIASRRGLPVGEYVGTPGLAKGVAGSSPVEGY